MVTEEASGDGEAGGAGGDREVVVSDGDLPPDATGEEVPEGGGGCGEGKEEGALGGGAAPAEEAEGLDGLRGLRGGEGGDEDVEVGVPEGDDRGVGHGEG